MDRSYVAETDAERERLRSLVPRLGDKELRRPMPGGWTVAALLAHIGFWDARAIFFLDRWGRGVGPSTADYEPEDVERVNDTAKPVCLALPLRDAAQLALRLAGRSAPPDLQDANGAPFNLSRATHRREHLDDIERAMGG